VGFEPGTREYFELALHFRSNREQPWLHEIIPFHRMSGKRILEVGSGPGFDALSFLKSGALYSGIDLVPENIERARKHLGFYGYTPDVREGDAEDLPFDAQSFDVVYSNGVLHHVPDMKRAFAEIHRVLKPAGDFYVILYHRNSIFVRISSVMNAIVQGTPIRDRFRALEYNSIGESPLVNVYSRHELRLLLREAGFSVESVSVRKLLPEDMPLPGGLLLRFYRCLPDSFYRSAGKLAGWYVCVHARKLADEHRAPT
jgi:ubiquinone/menaquinone biosynthesis C-methylase UbiE